MAVEQGTSSERVLAARERYVARGIATPPIVIARAEGARVEDVDGRSYIDFAGGLGCQNTGHGLPAAVAAIHEQVDQYLHQCFMVGVYEPYIEVCRRLGELSPCAGDEQKSILLNTGAEAVENAVKIARTATSKVVPYKRGFGPFAPEVYRTRSPYPYRNVSSDDAIEALHLLFKGEVAPQSVACVVLETVQGEGGFIPMPPDFPASLQEMCADHGILYVADEVQSGMGRTGPIWAIEHYGVEPDLVVSGKSLGGGLPLAGVTGRAEVVDSVEPGGLGGTFIGNPVACAAALAVLDELERDEFRTHSEELGRRMRSRLDEIATRVESVGEVRGLGPMLALELVADRETKEPAAGLTKRTTEAARKRGLILLSCGLYGNVVRILVPLVIADDDLDRGLEILEESLVHAAAG